jgi:hypothetical protein
MTASGGPPPPGPPPPYGYPPGPPVVEKTAMPVVGGVLLIIGAIAGIAQGALFIVGSAVIMPIDIAGVSELLAICGVIFLVTNLIGLIGGIFAAQRKTFGIAIVGSIMVLIFGGFFIGNIFGLIGLILVAISRKEFD